MINQDILRICKWIYNVYPYNLDLIIQQNKLWDNESISDKILFSDKRPYASNPLYIVITKILFIKFAHQYNLIQKIRNNIITHYGKKNHMAKLTRYERALFKTVNKGNVSLSDKQIINSYFDKFSKYCPNSEITIIHQLFSWQETYEGMGFWSQHATLFYSFIANVTWGDLIQIITQNYTLIKQYD